MDSNHRSLSRASRFILRKVNCAGIDGAAQKTWRGTDGSNPSPSSGESANYRFRDDFTGSTPRYPAPDVAADLIQLRCLLVDIDIEFDAEH